MVCYFVVQCKYDVMNFSNLSNNNTSDSMFICLQAYACILSNDLSTDVMSWGRGFEPGPGSSELASYCLVDYTDLIITSHNQSCRLLFLRQSMLLIFIYKQNIMFPRIINL